MQVESAFAASSANGAVSCGAWQASVVETGMGATAIVPGMQLACACTGVVVPARPFVTTHLSAEAAACAGGRDEGVMTFDAFTMASRGAYREYVAANMARS
ncbi:hypothetical protein [Paraburkholderia mimosarum]|uniref:hypothetical protein n=1 Tax=Paraburkholderia mimosarum TaxID=312026 RepID=UPI0004895D44|nr:hypothetical protein [Paraburkholderia mimosarum]